MSEERAVEATLDALLDDAFADGVEKGLDNSGCSVAQLIGKRGGFLAAATKDRLRREVLALSGAPGSVPPGALEEAEAIARQLVIAADADPELTMTMLLERGARAIRALCRLCALSLPPPKDGG